MAFTRRCIRSADRSTVEPADSERLVPDVRFTRRCSARLSSDVRFAREVVAQTGRYSNGVDRLEKLLAVDTSATLTNLDQGDVQPTTNSWGGQLATAAARWPRASRGRRRACRQGQSARQTRRHPTTPHHA